MTRASYLDFLKRKATLSTSYGFEVSPADINPILKPHQRDIVRWAVHKGRAAIFAAFGLGKTLMQLEAARLILAKAGGRFLIVAPLGVRQEFTRDAMLLGLTVRFIRRIEECDATGLYITNYETIRDGKLDPREFTGVSLDEASILRGFGGTKTFREFMRLFEGPGTYRFVATATPSPNEFIELLAYAAFLDVMDVGQAKTRFFKRNSEKADHLTIHPHKEREFWLWVSSWAIFLQRPSDLGYSDEGYDLWTDVTRMRTLNGAQYAAGREMHLCPLQFDIADRVITQFSMQGETVFDPFGGLMTVPLRAVKLGRRGIGVELNPAYFMDGLVYLRATEQEMATPTLFDLTEPEEATA